MSSIKYNNKDEEDIKGGKGKIRHRITSTKDKKLTLQKIYNMVINKELDNQTAKTLVYIINSAVAVEKELVTEEKMRELEEAVQKLKEDGVI